MNINPVYHHTNEKLQQELSWIQRAKSNPEHFGPLYKKYYQQIFRYIHQRMDDTELSTDVTSQVFLKALKNLHKYEFRGVPFGSWLYRIAKSEIYQAFRERQSKKTINVETLHLFEIIEDYDDSHNEESKMKLFQAISKLKNEDIQLIELRFFEKRPFKEIGRILNITENNAKVKCFRVLEKLKKIFFTSELKN